MYLAIARKWRPTKFEDLVGQGHVVQTLRNAILFQRVSHAYLFSGARGIGKTSVARIFAKALRCPNAKEALPCNTCEECVAISQSRSVDVVEIDGASNNGVEAVRGIRENVAYGASTGFYKIYIIDEVHMLSLSAFNALLKTLEEPPAHVIFIFATTEVQKIPLTILSRCQRFEFRRLSANQIVERLQYILQEEKVSISESGLRLIAVQADGSLRDAQSLLDQVLSFYGEEREKGLTIDEKKVVEALGVSDSSQLTRFIECVLKKELKPLLALISDVYFAGVDLKHFTQRALEELRLLYLIAVAQEAKEPFTANDLDISQSQFDALAALAKDTPLLQLERMAQILSKASEQISWSSLPRLVLEMAAIRMAKLDGLQQWENHFKAISSGSQPDGFSQVSEDSARQTARPAPIIEMKRPGLRAEPSKGESASGEQKRLEPLQEPRKTDTPSPARPAVSRDPHPDHWKGFVDTVMKKRPLLGALLCHSSFHMVGKTVALTFPEGFYDRQAKESKSDIEDALKNYFGKETLLNLSSGAASSIQSIEASKQAEAAELKKHALEHPTVLKMKEILGAEIVDVNVELT